MKLEAMKKIAEERTPGDWSIDRNSDGFVGIFYPDRTVKLANCVMGWDAEFIAMAANTYDKLLAVAEAAKNSPCRHITDIISNNCETCKALEELERE